LTLARLALECEPFRVRILIISDLPQKIAEASTLVPLIASELACNRQHRAAITRVTVCSCIAARKEHVPIGVPCPVNSTVH
jgi:hypothetical protein